MTKSVSSWLLYCRLRRQDGARIIAAEALVSLGFAILFAVFWLVIAMPNSFSKDGLIDGLGSITAVLAGFYVAGLVAIATFFRENSSLDDVIEKGPAILNLQTENEEHLTRRQYVCSIFGFLVFVSFFLAILSVIFRVSSKSIVQIIDHNKFYFYSYSIEIKHILEFILVFIWIFAFFLQIVLTLKGLYYLMDRIYDVKPVLGRPKNKDRDENDVEPL